MSTTPSPPPIVTSVVELREIVGAARRRGLRVGLVPTMGALHEGHLSLVRASKAECCFTVVTIFVNPSQFGPGEDLDRYPRTLAADVALLAREAADLVFAPANDEVYCQDHSTWVEVGSVARPLEGQCRPDHFRGVATVVLKLLNMVGPDVAFFGQKDYQQSLVIRRMVRELDVPVEIRVCPTVREPDGLAMSSRNAYLGPADRQKALLLSQSLAAARELVDLGERDAGIITQKMREIILSADDAQIDYVALADAETLAPVDRIETQTVVALAVKIGATRLIDNCLLEPPEGKPSP